METSQPLGEKQEPPRSAVYVNSPENFIFNAERIEMHIHIGEGSGAAAKPEMSVVGSRAGTQGRNSSQ